MLFKLRAREWLKPGSIDHVDKAQQPKQNEVEADEVSERFRYSGTTERPEIEFSLDLSRYSPHGRSSEPL